MGVAPETLAVRTSLPPTFSPDGAMGCVVKTGGAGTTTSTCLLSTVATALLACSQYIPEARPVTLVMRRLPVSAPETTLALVPVDKVSFCNGTPSLQAPLLPTSAFIQVRVPESKASTPEAPDSSARVPPAAKRTGLGAFVITGGWPTAVT